MMHIPDGYTEKEVLAAINKALNSLSSNFSFGYFDEDDMRQEGFIYAYKALPKFDPKNSKGCSLSNFLRIAIRRKFLNLRRDKLHRNSPPCSSCFFHKKVSSVDHKYYVHSIYDCSEYTDKQECLKWFGWSTRNQAKRSLVESCDVSKVTYATQDEGNDVFSHLSRKEFLQHVSDRIPLALRADYRRLIEGARLIKPRREAVIEAVRIILKEIVDDSESETW
jgi:hypothetical protein